MVGAASADTRGLDARGLWSVPVVQVVFRWVEEVASRSPAPPASGAKAITRLAVAGELTPLAGARSLALWALGCCHDADDLSGPEPGAAARWLVTRTRPGQAREGGEGGAGPV
jgi:hypothetical protein